MAKYKKILIFVLAFFIFLHTLSAFLKIIGTTAPDFSVYYYSTLDLVHNINPYTDKKLFTVFNYPILTNLVYLPFILLPYQLAQGLFIFLSLISIIGIVYFSFKLLKIKLSIYSFLLVLSLTFLAFPIKFTLGMGQSNLLAYFGLLFGIWLYQKKQIAQSGLVVGMVILIKPILGIFLLYFLIKRPKMIIYSFLIIITAFLITVFFGKFPLYVYYLKHLIPNLFSSQGKEVYYNQSLTGFISRLDFNQNLGQWFNYLISISLTIYVILKLKNQKTNHSIATLLCLLLIINPLSWQHHFVFLIFPFILVGKTLNKKSLKNIIALIIIYFLLSTNIQNPQQLSNFPFSLILSHYLYGTILLLFILLDN